MNNSDSMPKEVATALLVSGQLMTNTFRKTCKQARERIAEPISRSTALPISAPKTAMQRFERKLQKANAKQLTTWLHRALRKGNRLQDVRDNILFGWSPGPDKEKQVELIDQRLAEIDAVSQAINSELTSRATRGKVSNV